MHVQVGLGVDPAVIRELRLLLPQPGAPDPASSSFCRIVESLDVAGEDAVNPHVDAIEAPLIAWAEGHGLITDDAGAECLRSVCFHVLAARTYPRAPFEELLVAAKWCTWLFFHDDLLCDRAPTEEQGIVGPRVLAAAHSRLLAVLVGERAAAGDPLAASLHDIGVEALRWGGAEWMGRFIHDLRRHFRANEWEALNRSRQEAPPVSTYVKMRPHSGAVYTAFDFIEIVEDVQVPPRARMHLAFRQLMLMANNCICWLNDLYSLAKEIQEGNPNNLVLAIRAERGIALGEAMSEVVKMHNAELRAFEALAADLPRLGLDVDRELREYLAGVRSWMLGNAAWSRLTLRYVDLLNMLG